MSQSRTVRASFGGGGPPSFALNVVGSGTGSGSVQSQNVSPAISCTISSGSVTGGVCSGTYTSGTPITLTATPMSGHQFAGWSGNCSGTGTCSFTISSGSAVTAQAPAERIGEEIGDLIFAAAQLARHHQINPETALRDANARFERRFRYIERKLSEQGRAAADATMDELEALWVEAKGAEARK